MLEESNIRTSSRISQSQVERPSPYEQQRRMICSDTRGRMRSTAARNKPAVSHTTECPNPSLISSLFRRRRAPPLYPSIDDVHAKTRLVAHPFVAGTASTPCADLGKKMTTDRQQRPDSHGDSHDANQAMMPPSLPSSDHRRHHQAPCQFWELLQDSAYVEEQQRLLDSMRGISLAASRTAIASPDNGPRRSRSAQGASLSDTSHHMTLAASRMARSHSIVSTSRSAARRLHSTCSAASSSSTKSTSSISRLSSLSTTASGASTYSKSHRLNIRSSQHTYQAIADGTATLASCSNCATILQIPNDAKILYCVQCEQLTMLDASRDGRSGNHQPGSAGQLADRVVANAVQRQEIDVAVARKTARMMQQRDGHP